jgi:hypothetical protein
VLVDIDLANASYVANSDSVSTQLWHMLLKYMSKRRMIEFIKWDLFCGQELDKLDFLCVYSVSKFIGNNIFYYQ